MHVRTRANKNARASREHDSPRTRGARRGHSLGTAHHFNHRRSNRGEYAPAGHFKQSDTSSLVLCGMHPEPRMEIEPPARSEATTIAVLFASRLPALQRFEASFDRLLKPSLRYDSFISTDNQSMACLRAVRQQSSSVFVQSIRWSSITPDPVQALNATVGPLTSASHHWLPLVQWIRLRHAWMAMERHEARRRVAYCTVVKLRTDLHLTLPLAISPENVCAHRRPPLLFMRGDWIFWGARAVMVIAVGFAEALSHYKHLGDKAYLPIPWRHLLDHVGADGLAREVGFWHWLRFPSAAPSRSIPARYAYTYRPSIPIHSLPTAAAAG